jgi:hypothetical protein
MNSSIGAEFSTAIIDSGISGVNTATIAIAEWRRAQP